MQEKLTNAKITNHEQANLKQELTELKSKCDSNTASPAPQIEDSETWNPNTIDEIESDEKVIYVCPKCDNITFTIFNLMGTHSSKALQTR